MKIESVPEQKTTIQVIERMVALLDALAKYPDPVSLKELSKVSGLHPSTAHRILNDMVLTRFVDRIEPGTYVWGEARLVTDVIVEYRFWKKFAVFANLRNLNHAPDETEIAGPSTPAIARLSVSQADVSSLWTIGFKSSF